MKRSFALVLSLLLVFSWCFTIFAHDKVANTETSSNVALQGGNSELTPGEGGGGLNDDWDDGNPIP